jgi:UDP-N-acetylglucosamine:LPS N-acetylglucosamine transferase
MGHNSAARAIAEKVGKEFGDSKIFVEDLFKNAFNSKKYDMLFRLMIKRGKCLYNLVYRYTEDTGRNKKLPFTGHLYRSLGELIKKTDANVIISTLWSCSKIVSEYKRLFKYNIPLITCITDVSSHSEWLQPDTDYYLIAAPNIKSELVRKGIEPQRILVSGVPVRSEFETAEAADKPSEIKRILIMGGGLGLLPRTKSFYDELDTLSGTKTTVITGNNASMYNALVGRYKNIEVLAFVKDVPRYMKDADVIISKPGGITLFEAISAELPLLMCPPFLQQEIRNGEFVLENNLGVILPENTKKWTAKIREVLKDDGLLDKIRSNMRAFKSHLDGNALLRLIQQYERQSA